MTRLIDYGCSLHDTVMRDRDGRRAMGCVQLADRLTRLGFGFLAHMPGDESVEKDLGSQARPRQVSETSPLLAELAQWRPTGFNRDKMKIA